MTTEPLPRQREYLVINTRDWTAGKIENALNELDGSGWKLAGTIGSALILDRSAGGSVDA